MTCLCGFIDSNERTALVGGVDSGGGCACGGEGIDGKSLYFWLNFLRILKSGSKKIVCGWWWGETACIP